MKRISLFSTLLLLFAWATFATAAPAGGGPAAKPGKKMNDPKLSYLNLTDEQSEKIRSLRESHKKETLPLRTQLFNKRAELRLLWMQTSPDPDKIRATQKEILDLTGQLQEKRTVFQLAVRHVLTPEQLLQYLAHNNPRGLGPKHNKLKQRGRGPKRDKRRHNGPSIGPFGSW